MSKFKPGQKFFKAVYRTKADQLLSSNLGGEKYAKEVLPDTNVRLTYGVGIWTKPRIKDSGLFAATDVQSLRRAVGDSVEIWECQLKNPRALPYYDTGGFEDNIYTFWKAKKAKKGVRGYGKGYPNIVVGSALMLVKRIEEALP